MKRKIQNQLFAKYTFYAEMKRKKKKKQNVNPEQIAFIPCLCEKLNFFKIKKQRSIEIEYYDLLYHMFKQYGRAISFVRKFDPDLFNRVADEYENCIFENRKYKVLKDNLFASA